VGLREIPATGNVNRKRKRAFVAPGARIEGENNPKKKRGEKTIGIVQREEGRKEGVSKSMNLTRGWGGSPI